MPTCPNSRSEPIFDAVQSGGLNVPSEKGIVAAQRIAAARSVPVIITVTRHVKCFDAVITVLLWGVGSGEDAWNCPAIFLHAAAYRVYYRMYRQQGVDLAYNTLA